MVILSPVETQVGATLNLPGKMYWVGAERGPEGGLSGWWGEEGTQVLLPEAWIQPIVCKIFYLPMLIDIYYCISSFNKLITGH